MKKSRILAIVLAVLLLVFSFSLSACDNRQVIGILKYGNHESLNNCYIGIEKGLKEGLGDSFDNYKIEVLDANFDSSVSQANANALVNKNPIIIGSISTPTTLSAITASAGRVPIVFSAVSDPYSKDIALDSYDYVTGTRDLLDFEGGLSVVKTFLPNVEKIGVMVSNQEQNSISQLESFKKVCLSQNITVVEARVNATNEIPMSVDKLISQDIDCIFNLNDNTIVGALDVILERANEANIPVFGSEIEQVKKGCLASASLDYVELGRITGLMMSDIILKKKDIKDMPFREISDSFLCYNSSVMKSLGLVVDGLDAFTDVAR